MKKALILLLLCVCLFSGRAQTLQTVTDNGSNTTNNISLTPTVTATSPNVFSPALTIAPNYTRTGGINIINQLNQPDAVAGTYTAITPVTVTGSGAGAVISATVNSAFDVTFTITTPGTGYRSGDILSIPKSTLGSAASGTYSLVVGRLSSSGSFSATHAPLYFTNYLQDGGIAGAFTPVWGAVIKTRDEAAFSGSMAFGLSWDNPTSPRWGVRINGATGATFTTSGIILNQLVATNIVTSALSLGGELNLNANNANAVIFRNVGLGAPTFNTRSAGTKIVLLNSTSATSTDYAMGLENSNVWFGLPAYGSDRGWKWYGGTQQVAKLDGAGNLTVSGDISMGSNSDQKQLSVNGNIKARRIKVTTTEWADYVFAPSYKLKPLKEVEAYIFNNHHLPEVPSANEITKNGLDLGESQATLLKKIEELTLYIIEQNKQLEEQKKINEQQKQNNATLENRLNEIERKMRAQ